MKREKVIQPRTQSTFRNDFFCYIFVPKSTLGSRLEAILISALLPKVRGLQQTCYNLHVSGCIADEYNLLIR